MELSIVMPCLNEALTVKTCVLKARGFLDRFGVEGEVIVADNGSTDGSQKLAADAGARVINVQQRGYGAALLAGIEQAQGQYVVMGDADDSYDFEQLDDFLIQLRKGAQLVMGNRFRGHIHKGAMPFLHKYLGNPVLSFLGRRFFNIPEVGDFHCGLRAFHRESALNLGLVSTGMEFASELVVKAALAKLKIAEVPTVLRKDGRNRPPHLRTWRDGWRHLRFLLLHCPRWLFFYPGLFLVTAGTVIQAVLASGPVQVHGIGFDIHTMLYAAAASILGLQMIWLAVFSKLVATRSGLLPTTPLFERCLNWMSVERGLALGGAMILLGIIISAMSVSYWSSEGFGSLDPRVTMRTVIPAITLLLAGGELAIATLFIGLLHCTAPEQPASFIANAVPSKLLLQDRQ